MYILRECETYDQKTHALQPFVRVVRRCAARSGGLPATVGVACAASAPRAAMTAADAVRTEGPADASGDAAATTAVGSRRCGHRHGRHRRQGRGQGAGGRRGWPARPLRPSPKKQRRGLRSVPRPTWTGAAARHAASGASGAMVRRRMTLDARRAAASANRSSSARCVAAGPRSDRRLVSRGWR